jgi:hypothetical protein
MANFNHMGMLPNLGTTVTLKWPHLIIIGSLLHDELVDLETLIKQIKSISKPTTKVENEKRVAIARANMIREVAILLGIDMFPQEVEY